MMTPPSNSRPVPKVPPRKRKEIEDFADRLSKKHHPEQWAVPGPTPILDFLEYSLRDYKVDYGVSNTLGFGVEGATYPRGANREFPEVVLAESVMADLYRDLPRARFTTAHEIGHGLLHAKYLQTALVEGRRPALFRQQELPRYEDPEWQGHVFAAAFLMPTGPVTGLVKRWGADPDILAETFMVSRRAAELRLHHMGWAVL